jgi:transposase
MIRKMAGPGGVSANSLARDVGIPQSTLSRWLKAAGTVGGLSIVPPAERREQVMAPRRPRDWPPEEKLNAVFEAQSLSEDELGAFLRRKGLHEAQLQEWRTIILSGLQGNSQRTVAKPSTGEVRRIRELEKELERKDKALAETAALLVLQKKVRALWGDADAPTGKKSGR